MKAIARRESAAVRRKRPAAKPDMRAFSARAAARLRAWYGGRVVADSGPLLDELRKDASV